ncbi:hypothetical protein GGI00_003573, partial [Coemansia sp. RSA 2681]
MPSPLDIVAYQSRKARLSEVEQQALQRASARQFRYKIVGGALGCGAGYLFTRRTTSKPLKLFMMLFNGALAYNVGMSVASLMSLREMSNEQKYPHIVAAMRDLKTEILRSSGFDPNNPDAPHPRTRTAQRKINVKDLPPPMTEEEKAMRANEGVLFGKEAGDSSDHVQDDSMSQYSFGNPGLQQAMEDNQPVPRASAGADAPSSTWESIRKTNSAPENAWSKIRKQSSSQQQQQQQKQQYQHGSEGDQLSNAWDRLGQQNSGEGSFAGDSAGWGAPGAPAL